MKKNLTPAQRQNLNRIANGGAFTGSIPEWRLVHLGLIELAMSDGSEYYARVTAQGRIVNAETSDA